MAVPVTAGAGSDVPSRATDSRDLDDRFVIAAWALTAHLDLAGVSQAILDAVDALFDARSACVLLSDTGGRRLRVAAVRGGVPTTDGIEIPAATVCHRAWNSGAVAFTSGIRSKAPGAPPRWTCPRVVTRRSKPISSR